MVDASPWSAAAAAERAVTEQDAAFTIRILKLMEEHFRDRPDPTREVMRAAGALGSVAYRGSPLMMTFDRLGFPKENTREIAICGWATGLLGDIVAQLFAAPTLTADEKEAIQRLFSEASAILRRVPERIVTARLKEQSP